MSPEIAVMRRPAAAYRRLAANYPTTARAGLVRRPALAALVIGSAIGLAATGRATAPLVFSTTLCWSFAVIWQVIAAAIAVRGAHATLTFAQRFDLFFAGHAPWSLWLLTTAAWSRIFPDHTDLYALLCTVVLPGAWTVVIVYGFCTGALALPRSRAVLRTAAHQALIWGFAFVYVSWAVALWPRMAAAFTS